MMSGQTEYWLQNWMPDGWEKAEATLIRIIPIHISYGSASPTPRQRLSEREK